MEDQDQNKLNDIGAELDFANPWERLPDEPARQYSWFHCYLLLGAGRSLRSAYRQFQNKQPSQSQKAAKSGVLKPPPGWQTAFMQFDWKARAQSWDEAQRFALEIQMEQRRHDYAETSWTFIEKLHARAEAMLKHPLTEKKLSRTTTGEIETVNGQLTQTVIHEYTVRPTMWRAGDVTRHLQVADILARSAMGIEVDEILREIGELDDEQLTQNAAAAIEARRGGKPEEN